MKKRKKGFKSFFYIEIRKNKKYASTTLQGIVHIQTIGKSYYRNLTPNQFKQALPFQPCVCKKDMIARVLHEIPFVELFFISSLFVVD